VDTPALLRLGRTALPIVATLLLIASVAGVLAFAGSTLGYDFRAYHAAAARVLDGQPLYDLGFEAAGGFGLFYYPPLFAPFILPFGLLAESTAVVAWIGVLLALFGLGVAILPVARVVRWWIVLLAGLSWPFLYAVKLGQVGPILFLLFAIGWRWLADPGRVGTSIAIGTAVKLQPAILFLWALLTRRWAAVATGIVALGVLAVVATLLVGVTAWTDFVQLVRQVADPITTPHNVTPGAIAFQLGASTEVASAVQWASVAAVLAAIVAAARWATDESSFLVAVIASQLMSPVLWDHYAMLLLLPVAYLCSRGHWWAVLIPLSTALPLVGVTPPIAYPLGFLVALVATLAVGIRARRIEAR
jgi:alpha-1,2-mannosyltransferase